MTRSPLVWLVPLALTLIALALQVDHPLAQTMATVGPRTKRVAEFVSWFGKGGVILYPAGILIVLCAALKVARPAMEATLDPILRALIVVFVIVAASGLAVDVLKFIFGRARPFIWLAGDESGFHPFRLKSQFNAFPSGHTTTSFAAALAFAALFPRLRILFFAFAVAIGASRVVQNVHYLSDVLAGAALGLLVAFLLLPWFRKRGWIPLRDSRNHPRRNVVIT